MPDISAACDGTVFLVVVGNFDTVQNTLRSNDLIRTHNKQQVLRSEDTVFRQDIEDRVLCKKGLCKVHKIGNDLVVRICPKGRKLKAVACFRPFASLARFLDCMETCRIGIILRVCAVGDHKNLHIFIKTAPCPEAVTLIAVYLIECFTDRYATPFQLDMHQRKAVDKHRHVIAILPFACIDFILIDDLQAVVMDILLVDQRNVLCRAVVTPQILNVVFLNRLGFFYDTLIGIGDIFRKKAFPFAFRECVAVEPFNLRTEIGNKVIFLVNRQIFIAQLNEPADKILFKLRFTLVRFGSAGFRCVLSNYGVFACSGYDVEITHTLNSYILKVSLHRYGIALLAYLTYYGLLS